MAKKYEEFDAHEVNGVVGGETDEEELFLNQIMGSESSVREAPKVKIILHNQDGPDGDKAKFVAVNGVGFSIPREVPVFVPQPIVVALENATETRYYREERDGQSFGPIITKEVRRFPFSILS